MNRTEIAIDILGLQSYAYHQDEWQGVMAALNELED